MKITNIGVLIGINIILLLTLVGTLVFFSFKSSPQKPQSVEIHSQNSVIAAPVGELAASMQIYINEQDLVTAFELVDVDLTRNTRSVVWFYADTFELTQIYKKYESTKVGDTPWLFGDKALIERNLSIINGSYNCVPITDTPLPRLMPGVDQYTKHLCVVAVPPDYGKFSGYLSAWLTRTPTNEEIYRLVKRMREFSAKIN